MKEVISFAWALETVNCTRWVLFCIFLSLAVGYVLFPNGKKAGIDWSNASLAEMADDGIIRDLHRVSFTAGKLKEVTLSSVFFQY